MSPPPVPPDPRKAPSPAAPQAAPPPPAPANALAPAQEGEQPYVQEITFWEQPFVQNVLPFLVSLTLHVGVLILAFRFASIVEKVIGPTLREQVTVAEGEMMAEDQQDGIPNPGLGWDPTRAAAQDKYPDVPKDSKGIAEKPGTDLIPKLAGGGGGEGESSMIGLGPRSALGAGSGLGTGTGSGTGAGDGDGSGVLAPFGVPGGGMGLGPKSNFIGLRGQAKRVAYVCDASGSMLDMFDLLRIEIRKSVDNLRPVQAFNVVFFQDQNYMSVEKVSLLPATPENKKKNIDFLDKMVPRGQTDPIPALEAVSKMNPELIYLLTDGDFSGPGNDKVVDFCKSKFSDGKTKIHTIAFISKDSKDNPQDMEFVKALQTIAKNSGGNFRHVSEDDMGK